MTERESQQPRIEDAEIANARRRRTSGESRQSLTDILYRAITIIDPKLQNALIPERVKEMREEALNSKGFRRWKEIQVETPISEMGELRREESRKIMLVKASFWKRRHDLRAKTSDKVGDR